MTGESSTVYFAWRTVTGSAADPGMDTASALRIGKRVLETDSEAGCDWTWQAEPETASATGPGERSQSCDLNLRTEDALGWRRCWSG